LTYLNIVKGEKADATMVDTINNADLKVSKSFLKEYNEEASRLFPDTCAKCGSDEITKSSSERSADGGEGNEGSKKVIIKSNSEVLKKYRNR
jgi:hypothetical protein